MLKKTITYKDYNEVERTEDFYFNLSKAELMDMEIGIEGGMVELINRVVAAKDNVAIMNIFKKLVLQAYGEKSADGKRFIKSEELSTAFSQTEAYSDLYIELSTDATKAAEFVNGIIPAIDKKAFKQIENK